MSIQFNFDKKDQAKLQEIVTQYKDQLIRNDLDAVYHDIFKSKGMFAGVQSANLLTQLLVSKKINPLKYVTAVPFCYIQGIDIGPEIRIYRQIKEIKNYAFGSAGIEKVIWYGAPEKIGHNVFNDCTNLRELVIPEGVKSIGDSFCVGSSNLEKVILPASLESIGKDPFVWTGNNLKIKFKGDLDKINTNDFSRKWLKGLSRG